MLFIPASIFAFTLNHWTRTMSMVNLLIVYTVSTGAITRYACYTLISSLGRRKMLIVPHLPSMSALIVLVTVRTHQSSPFSSGLIKITVPGVVRPGLHRGQARCGQVSVCDSFTFDAPFAHLWLQFTSMRFLQCLTSEMPFKKRWRDLAYLTPLSSLRVLDTLTLQEKQR